MQDSSFAFAGVAHGTVLVVVQEAAVRELISFNLRHAGFYPVQAESRTVGQQLIAEVLPDAIVLDIDSPATGGLLFAQDVRARGLGRQTPIVMLTGTPHESCGSHGTACGADDCVAKPFTPKELVSRLTHLLGHRLASAAAKPKAHLLRVGALEVDTVELTVKVHGAMGTHSLSVPAAEFRLLQYFMSTPDRVHTRDQLLAKVWRGQDHMDPRTVDQNIRRLRSNLESVGLGKLIQTVRGVGYRLSAPHARFATPA